MAYQLRTKFIDAAARRFEADLGLTAYHLVIRDGRATYTFPTVPDARTFDIIVKHFGMAWTFSPAEVRFR